MEQLQLVTEIALLIVTCSLLRKLFYWTCPRRNELPAQRLFNQTHQTIELKKLLVEEKKECR